MAEQDQEQVQVLGFWESPYSCRVELALKLKGVDYQYIGEDLPYNKSDLLLKYNPIYKKIPVLLHNGKPIVESLVILEYIDETWRDNHPIIPQDPYERARARFWAKYIDDKVVSAVLKAAGSKGEERQKSIEEAEETLEALSQALGNKVFFGGDRIGFVDIAGIVVAHWVPAIQECFGFELLTTHNFPNLINWSEQLANHFLVKQILPPKHQILSFIQANWKF